MKDYEWYRLSYRYPDGEVKRIQTFSNEDEMIKYVAENICVVAGKVPAEENAELIVYYGTDEGGCFGEYVLSNIYNEFTRKARFRTDVRPMFMIAQIVEEDTV